MEYQEIVKNLKTKIHKLSYIHQISHNINSILDLDELLEYALSQALHALASESGSIFLWNPDDKELELRVSQGRSSEEIIGIKKRLGEGIIGCVARDGKPMLVRDVNDDPRINNESDTIINRYKTNSFLCVPLMANKKLIGVINVTEKKTKKPFNDDELEFLFILSNHTAIAIDNRMLYKKVHCFNEELQDKIDRATEELQEIVEESIMLKTYNENIIESLSTGVFVVDNKGYVTMWNHGMEKKYNILRNNAIGSHITEILNNFDLDQLRDAIINVMKEQTSIFLEKVNVRISGSSTAIVNFNIFPLYNKKRDKSLGVVVLNDDVTDKVELENEVSINERLALIGKMASGLAHELNNPLDGTRRFINLSLDHISNSEIGNIDMAEEYMLSAKDGINRMIGIVRSLLEFSRQTKQIHRKCADINKTIDDALHVVKLKKPMTNIEIIKELSSDLAPVVDFSLQTVFTNIVSNAIDSMRDRGMLHIVTKRSDNDNKMAEISISDNGCGIEDENIKNIFDPFFTTKSDNNGTGLGLALCRELISRSNGNIDVKSVVGKGTTFIINLPFVTRVGGE